MARLRRRERATIDSSEPSRWRSAQLPRALLVAAGHQHALAVGRVRAAHDGDRHAVGRLRRRRTAAAPIADMGNLAPSAGRTPRWRRPPAARSIVVARAEDDVRRIVAADDGHEVVGGGAVAEMPGGQRLDQVAAQAVAVERDDQHAPFGAGRRVKREPLADLRRRQVRRGDDQCRDVGLYRVRPSSTAAASPPAAAAAAAFDRGRPRNSGGHSAGPSVRWTGSKRCSFADSIAIPETT